MYYFETLSALKEINVKHIAQNSEHLVCACLVFALGNLTLVLVLRRVFKHMFFDMQGNSEY